MKIKYYFIIASLILTSCSKKLDQEVIYFDDINFNSGNYKLYFIGTEGTYIDNYKDFKIENIYALNKIKKTWIFTERSEVMSCGYGYILYLVDGQQVLKTTGINIECEYFSDWIKFPKKHLTDFKEYYVQIDDSELSEFHNKYTNIKK
ncbi:MAG: hypothetical protein ABJG99_11760 [Crocinitomicaceae bacterium]